MPIIDHDAMIDRKSCSTVEERRFSAGARDGNPCNTLVRPLTLLDPRRSQLLLLESLDVLSL